MGFARCGKNRYDGVVLSDEELGRRLAAARAYRRMKAKEVEAAAKKLGQPKGFGSSMLSLTEGGRHPNGTDRRSVRVLCEIYDLDYDLITNPNTKLFAAPTIGIIEEMREQISELADVVSDISGQVQTGLFQRDQRLGASERNAAQGSQAEPQSD